MSAQTVWIPGYDTWIDATTGLHCARRHGTERVIEGPTARALALAVTAVDIAATWRAA